METAGRPGAVRWGLALVAPLGVLALGYGLWATSDRLGYIGPLDKAQFGWLVVIPVVVDPGSPCGQAAGRDVWLVVTPSEVVAS